jgi:glycosyltransferase involved in cell wall biosynthesis
LLAKCLQSIDLQRSIFDLQVIVVVNGEDQNTIQFLNKIKFVEVYNIKKTSPAQARNFATLKACGDYFLFLDDDTTLSDYYFARALELITVYPNAAVFGGPDKMRVQAFGLEKVFSLAIESPFCTGPTRNRHSNNSQLPMKGNEMNLILCHMWFKSKLFTDKRFQFNKDLFKNEETDIVRKLTSQSETLIYDPQLFVHHKRKNSLTSIVQTYFLSGKYRSLLSIQSFRNKDILFFIPCFLIIISLFNKTFLSYGLIAYTILSIQWLFLKNEIKRSLPTIFIQLAILTSYATGTFYGFTYAIFLSLKKLIISLALRLESNPK